MQASQNNSVEEVKSRLDIAEVISRYMPLKRAGVNFRGLCPFHGEKTPSFHVTPARQIWHCFGCGEGGDVISFVQKIEKLEFREALEMLAEQAGIELPSFDPGEKKNKQEKEELLKIAAFAAEFYHRTLLSPSGVAALKYLSGRGLTLQTIKKWKIGFCPMDGQAVLKELAKYKISGDKIVRSGIYSRSDKNIFYDRFRGRVTFPIFNIRGQVVGFSARILEANANFAKYVNSAESPIYHKSEILFGLFQAKEFAAKSKELLVVEGQMDCISCHQAGFENTVATSGTAFTEIQAKVVRRVAGSIILCFDSDKAGQEALRKAALSCLGIGLEVFVVSLGESKDPDELIRTNLEAWKMALASKKHVLDHYIQMAKTLHTSGSLSRVKFATEFLTPLLKLIKDPLEREHWQDRVVSELGISEHGLSLALEGSSDKSVEVESGQQFGLEKQVLGGFLLFEKLMAFARDLGISSDDFVGTENKKIVDLLMRGEVALVKSLPIAKEAEFVVESLYQNSENGSASDVLEQLEKSCRLLRQRGLSRSLKEISLKLQEAQNQGDLESIKFLKTSAADLAQKRLLLEQ
jgi:DNA primase